MREDDLIKSVEPIIDEITALNKKIDNVKTIKGDKGDEGEKGEQGAQGETGQEGIGVNTKEWTKGIYREGQIVQHFIGQQFKALKDTDKEPSNGEDWERIGTNGFRWTGVKSDKTKYEDGDLFIDSGTTFLMVDGKAKMFAQRGKNGVNGKDGVDGKAAREFVHVKWHSKGISFVYDDGEIIEADVDGLNEIQKRMTFIEEMFESNESIDAPIKRYAGVYTLNTSYAVGDTVTEAKSLYLCIKADANSNSLDPERWVKICNAQGSGGKGGGGGEFLPLKGGTMTGIIGSESKEFASLKLNSLQEINVREKNGGLDINLQPEHSSIFRIANGKSAGLTVDGKHLVTASKEQDDELIKETASDYYLTTRKYVLDRVKENNDLIIELEEEIDSIVPASERGTWLVDDPNSPLRPPTGVGTFYMMDTSDIANTVITRNFENVTSLIISKTDKNGASHPFTSAKVGDHIEVFESADSDYMLAKIETIDNSNADYVLFGVNPESWIGGLDGTNVSARIKVFNLATGLLLESLMPKAGGTFTGDVKLDRGDLHVKSSHVGDGISFQVWNGNDYQQLLLNGEGNFQYRKPQGVTTSSDTVATLGDLSSMSLPKLHRTISSGYGNTTVNYVSAKSLNTNEFSSVTNPSTTTKYYIFRGYDYNGTGVKVIDYKNTEDSILEIYENTNPPTLIVKSSVRQVATSGYSNQDAMVSATAIWAKPSYTYSTSKKYFWIMTGMAKKIGTRMESTEDIKK